MAAILAGLTARYVRLTREIASSSLAQVRHLKEVAKVAQQQGASALASLALRVRVSLAELDATSLRHRQLRSFSLLADRDLTDMEALARQVHPEAVTYAAKASISLRAILGLIEKAKSIHESQGWIARDEEVERWRVAMEAAPRMLTELERVSREQAAA